MNLEQHIFIKKNEILKESLRNEYPDFNFDITEEENHKDSLLLEFANVPPFKTGLPCNIWVDDLGFERKNKHSPYRIKFQNNTNPKVKPEDLIPIIISDEPFIPVRNLKEKIDYKLFKIVSKFVKENEELLKKLSDQEINIFDFVEQLKRSN